MAHLFTCGVFLFLTCVGSIFLSGCMCDRAANNIGYGVTERLFGKMMDIPFWADTFREGKVAYLAITLSCPNLFRVRQIHV